MKTKLFLALEKKVEEWMNENCEDDEWPDIYTYTDLTEDMALAAKVVFDANSKGQIFARE